MASADDEATNLILAEASLSLSDLRTWHLKASADDEATNLIFGKFLHAGSSTSEDMAPRQQLQGLAEAASGYHKVLAENRQLYNEVQDLKGNIRVYCRVRPFLPGQFVKHSAVEFVGENGDLLVANPMKQGKDGHKMFSFNKSFGPSATQEEVFMDTRPLIRSVLDGYNVCIFAYGQTGSGKTYTMTGPSSLSEKDWGVNYRALNDLFHISQSREDVFKYEVGVQMVEIYNEQVRDLLLIEGSNKRLAMINHSQLNGLNVPDASMLPVTSTLDVLELIKIGQKNRAVGATALNERSSRSHSVLTVHVQGTDLASGSILRGCLHLVDLAGSERVDRSEATGDRLKEAQHINKSLSALGDVVSALAQKSSHVPYRNSKLTQLLQNSLAGQAKTLMFVHISLDMESNGETVSTLKFAERVASVELGAARSNKESREVRDLKEQVTMLKEVIAKKDGEIDRLQLMRTSSVEETGPVEKPKARPDRGLYFHKPPPVQMKQTLSDGYVSQAETEVSLSGVAEQIASIRKEQRTFSGQRKPPQPQIPRPSDMVHDESRRDATELKQAHGSTINHVFIWILRPYFDDTSTPPHVEGSEEVGKAGSEEDVIEEKSNEENEDETVKQDEHENEEGDEEGEEEGEEEDEEDAIIRVLGCMPLWHVGEHFSRLRHCKFVIGFEALAEYSYKERGGLGFAHSLMECIKIVLLERTELVQRTRITRRIRQEIEEVQKEDFKELGLDQTISIKINLKNYHGPWVDARGRCVLLSNADREASDCKMTEGVIRHKAGLFSLWAKGGHYIGSINTEKRKFMPIVLCSSDGGSAEYLRLINAISLVYLRNRIGICKVY